MNLEMVASYGGNGDAAEIQVRPKDSGRESEEAGKRKSQCIQFINTKGGKLN